MNNALDDLGTSIGPYYVGSVPRPLDITVTMEDDTTPVDIAGAEASFSYKIDNGTARWAEAEVHDGPNGIIRINWAESDFLTAGTMRGIAYWAVEGNVEAAALVWCSVRTPPAPIVPGANPSPPIDGGDASTERPP